MYMYVYVYMHMHLHVCTMYSTCTCRLLYMYMYTYTCILEMLRCIRCAQHVLSLAGNGTGTGSDQIGIETVIDEITLEAGTGRRGGTRRNRETRTETETRRGTGALAGTRCVRVCVPECTHQNVPYSMNMPCSMSY